MQDLKFRRRHKKRRAISVNGKKARRFLAWAAQIFLAGALAVLLVWFFGQRVSNAGDSMKPVLNNGDVVLVNRMVYNARRPGRGDIIAFRPNGNENVHYSIKRIAGLPGETVQILDGSIYINGEEQAEDIYASDIEYAGAAAQPVELGENEYFVIGDNHAGSDDSRMAVIWTVGRDEIYGKVWFVASFGRNFGFVKD